MSAPPALWSAEEVAADVKIARELFRKTRFAEPLTAWVKEVDERTYEFSRLFDEYGVARSQMFSASDIPDIIDAGLLSALRYLTGPPISSDDLRNLAAVTSFSPLRLRVDPAACDRLFNVIRESIDSSRFPWLADKRDPTELERSKAVFGSALLLAAQRLQTLRRTSAKTEQERAVRDHLQACGFKVVRFTRITNYAQFPPLGVVSENEVQFGPEKADVLSRLWDDRMFPIECKVSNSEVNSYKRLNHDTLAKHHAWIQAFGKANVVPSAILAGVFKATNVFEAQRMGLTIFWSHRISDIERFVASTRR